MPQNFTPGAIARYNTYHYIDETDISNLSNVEPFANREEQEEAFRNPRYKTSAAFRQEVARRVAAGGFGDVTRHSL